jgi:uncharacterized membrane protein YdjX (TVP38/TMEM64 family)
MTDQQQPVAPDQQQSKGGLWKILVAVVVIGGGVIAAWQLGLFEYISMENVDKLKGWFDGLGWYAPAVFILIWIVACVFFLPGLPITIVGGLVFGATFGTIYSIVGSTLGATAAFLVGRYAARDMVAGWVQNNNTLRKIDEGVKREGWRMLMITRLVPIFPFNAQNYVYGLTKINVVTYALISFVTMLPACAMFNFAAGAVRKGTANIGQSLMYLGIAAVLFVLLSFLPRIVQKKFASKDLVEGGE